MRNEVINLLEETVPESRAYIRGGNNNPDIFGEVFFYSLWDGTIVLCEISGLPSGKSECEGRFFGFHIHEGEACKDAGTEAFGAAGGHFNPGKCEHPFHDGDMPPLIGNGGYCFWAFFTDRFTPEEVIGRTIVIHDMPDDFKTQPSGNSGIRIACGQIKKY